MPMYRPGRASYVPLFVAAMALCLPAIAFAAPSTFPLIVLPGGGTKTVKTRQATFDIGKVILESLKHPILRDFIVCNNFAVPVQVTEIRPECECTSAQALDGSAPYSIVPSGRSTIRVTVDPALIGPGPLDKSVTIFVAGQEGPALTLHVTGSVVSAAAFEPSNFYFGPVPVGSTPSTSFTQALDKRHFGADAPDPLSSSPDFSIRRIPQTSVAPEAGVILRTYSVTVSSMVKLGFR